MKKRNKEKGEAERKKKYAPTFTLFSLLYTSNNERVGMRMGEWVWELMQKIMKRVWKEEYDRRRKKE